MAWLDFTWLLFTYCKIAATAKMYRLKGSFMVVIKGMFQKNKTKKKKKEKKRKEKSVLQRDGFPQIKYDI